MAGVKRIFIGVAWPYVNGDLHVGHLAGYLIPCDVFARWARLSGYQVLMVSGTDCHGTPITVEADKKGITPYELIKIYTPRIHRLIKTYKISYDLFTATTTPNHIKTTQRFFLNLLKNGYIIKKSAPQYYSPEDKRFLPDRYVEGECPYCHAKAQRADQCEVCGRVLDSGQLIKPYSKLTKAPVTLKESQHYYIDFPKLEADIRRFVEGSTHWMPWVWQEAMGWLKEGLKARPITRDLDWGVPLPIDDIPDDMLIEGAKDKRFYVWFDAVIGYFSASLEWAKKQGQPDKWRDFWLDKSCRHYYFMGQDNLPFHTIFWPGQLIGQKQGYNLPYFPCVQKYLNLEGQKFSKSRGIIIDSIKAAKQYRPDVVRFYILSILPETKQSSWQWAEFKRLVNANLVDTLGNFIQRVVSFYTKQLDGTIDPQARQVDKPIQDRTRQVFDRINQLMPACKLKESFELSFDYARGANQYLNQTKPWITLDKQPLAAQRSIYTALYIVHNLQVLLSPFLPETADKIADLLGLEPLTPQEGQPLYRPVKIKSLGRLNTDQLPLFTKLDKIVKV